MTAADKGNGHLRLRRYGRRLTFISLCLATAGIFVAAAAFGMSKDRRAHSPRSGVQTIHLPDRYRDWSLISVAHEAGKLNDIRAILGNDTAYQASRQGTIPFPDGAMIARVAWTYTSSEQNDKVFGIHQSFVAGQPTNVQLLVKDSRAYPATGGWGFAQFENHSSLNKAVAAECFACHLPAKGNDYVFTHYAP